MVARRVAGFVSAVAVLLSCAAVVPLACKTGGGTGEAKAPTRANGPPAAWLEAVNKVKNEWKGTAKLSKPKSVKKAGAGTQVDYSLDLFPVLIVYPNPQLLPQAYQGIYGDVMQTVQMFTLQSLQNDGFTDATVTVSQDALYVNVTIVSSNPGIQSYPDAHAAFVFWAAQSLIGDAACYTCTSCSSCPGLCPVDAPPNAPCWDPSFPDADATQPWAPFLPLGLPLVNQQAVTFLDYPPATSLKYKNYLQNFTMERWSAVLSTVGIPNPVLYETIVDSRPIAAAGSGQTDYLPQPLNTFNDAGGGGYYLSPMLSTLTSSSSASPLTLPMIVLGQPAMDAWSTMIGASPPLQYLDVGTSQLPLSGKKTNWVVSRHPDDTTYQCCAGDPYPKCCVAPYPCWQLVPFETNDLIASCIVQTYATSPNTSPQDAKTACTNTWTSASKAHTVCVRARLDYDYKSTGACTCQAAAEKFCNDNGDQACTATWKPCDNSVCSTGAAPKAKTPRIEKR